MTQINGNTYHINGLKKINIVKMLRIPKDIYRLSEISQKLNDIFKEIKKS